MDHYSQDSSGIMGGMAHMGAGGMAGLVLLAIVALAGYLVQNRMMAAMNRFSQMRAPMTGAQTAELMMLQNNLRDVQIKSVGGQLTDHFNPGDLSVNLSELVYKQPTVTAMAVAAHECGHALQHAQAYPWIALRSRLVPVVGIGSKLGMILLMVGLFLTASGGGTAIAWLGLAFFASTTLFAFVTLPVEFDASRRAMAWLKSTKMLSPAMEKDAAVALRWAAMTYVVAALSSVAMLLYYAMLIMNRSGRR